MKGRKSFPLVWGMLVVGVALGLCAFPLGQAYGVDVPVTIDNMETQFGTSAAPLLSCSNAPCYQILAQTPTPVPGVFGGNRILDLNQTTGTAAIAKAFVDGHPILSQRAWVVSNDTGSTANGTIYWSGSSATTPVGCNLPQPLPYSWASFKRLELTNVTTDQNTVWTVSLYSNGGSNVSTATFTQPGNTVIPLKLLTRATDFIGNVDYASLCRIQITFVGADAIDTAIPEVTAILDVPQPKIHCALKTLGLKADLSDQGPSLQLPNAPSFDGDLYVQLSITNTATDPASSGQVNIQDVLPAGMSFQDTVQVQKPAGFNLGANPANGSTGTISWTTVDSLGPLQTLEFSFKVHLTMNAPGTLTNTFRAKATTDSDFVPPDCTASVSLGQAGKVPTMNEWGAIILTLILAASAVWLLRKRRVI